MAPSNADSSDRDERVFRVLPRQVGQTIAAALREWLPGQSWTQLRKLLETRRIMVSGNLCTDAGRRLKLQDVVKALPHSIPAPPRETDIRVVYLDSQLIVVDKPPGVTSTRHSEERNWSPRRRQIQPTLDEMLPAVIAQREGRRGKGKPPPVRAVHRLDRETSGLMVFARTPSAEKHLAQQFRQHTTKRRYLAIARGEVQEQTIESRLVRDRGDGRRGSTPLPGAGKKSNTHFKPLEKFGGYTLVECRPETGRTHQIRIHLSEAGHPLCGEKVYLQPLFRPAIKDASGAPRLALCAVELEFQHPVSGKRLHFEIPLAKDLDEFARRIGRSYTKSP
ncbi:MAG: RluA family pseudouridine synthase [Pirellulales bacterium]|nr:RluA family pseudouridine synthase [Pirellulales bacterium]